MRDKEGRPIHHLCGKPIPNKEESGPRFCDCVEDGASRQFTPIRSRPLDLEYYDEHATIEAWWKCYP